MTCFYELNVLQRPDFSPHLQSPSGSESPTPITLLTQQLLTHRNPQLPLQSVTNWTEMTTKGSDISTSVTWVGSGAQNPAERLRKPLFSVKILKDMIYSGPDHAALDSRDWKSSLRFSKLQLHYI